MYVESTGFHEIWPEHSLTNKEGRVSANSFILNTFLVAVPNATHYTIFFVVELDRSIKDNQ